MTAKTLKNTNFDQVKENVSDVKSYGNPDLFKCVSKAWSESEGWMKSTKVMEIWNVGCVVQVTTQQGTNVSEALTFVPGVRLYRAGRGEKDFWRLREGFPKK